MQNGQIEVFIGASEFEGSLGVFRCGYKSCLNNEIARTARADDGPGTRGLAKGGSSLRGGG